MQELVVLCCLLKATAACQDPTRTELQGSGRLWTSVTSSRKAAVITYTCMPEAALAALKQTEGEQLVNVIQGSRTGELRRLASQPDWTLDRSSPTEI